MCHCLTLQPVRHKDTCASLSLQAFLGCSLQPGSTHWDIDSDWCTGVQAWPHYPLWTYLCRRNIAVHVSGSSGWNKHLLIHLFYFVIYLSQASQMHPHQRDTGKTPLTQWHQHCSQMWHWPFSAAPHFNTKMFSELYLHKNMMRWCSFLIPGDKVNRPHFF